MPQPPSLVLMGKDRVVQIKRRVKNDRKISYYSKILFPNMTLYGISFFIQNCIANIHSFCLQLLFSRLYVLFIHSAAGSFQVLMTKGFYEHSCTHLVMVVVVVEEEEEEDMCQSFFWVYD